jgi:quercetin dioxygenase-like cupin family protein
VVVLALPALIDSDSERKKAHMNKPANRGFLRAVTILGAALVLATVAAVPSLATAPVGFVSTIVARGTDQSVGNLVLQQGTDVVVGRNVFDVGGWSGWHSHPGGAIVVVVQGQVTLYRSVGNHCDIRTYTAGQSFLERPSDIVNAANSSSGQTIVYATFPGVPAGGSPRIDRANPGTCPGA